MLHLFPTPYPDELLYSVVCRYHIRSGNITVQQTRSDLSFLNNGNSYSHILPSKLGHLSKQLPFACSLTVEQLIENHTLFPYYRSYLTYKEQTVLKNFMIGKKTRSIALLAKIPKLELYNSSNLKFCSLCLEQDLKIYGETYWHRSHQMPGITICLNHDQQLLESRATTEAISRNFILPTFNNCDVKELHGDSSVKETLSVFARKIIDEINQPSQFISLKHLRDSYRQLLRQEDSINLKNGEINPDQLADQMIQYYGLSALSIIHPEIMDKFSDYLSLSLMACDLLTECDRVLHWLVQKFIEDNY